MNFKEITNEVLSFADTNSESFRNRAKQSVRAAVQMIEHSMLLKESEGVGVVLYPANEFSVDVGKICGGEIISLRNVQLLSQESDREGRPLEIVDYNTVQEFAWRWIQERGYDFTWEQVIDNDLTEEQLTEFRDFVRNCDRYMVFRLGKSIGMFPTPTKDTYLLLNFYRQAESLTEDSSTNYLLENYDQLVLWSAAKIFAGYIKNKDLFELAGMLQKDAFEAAKLRNANLQLSQ